MLTREHYENHETFPIKKKKTHSTLLDVISWTSRSSPQLWYRHTQRSMAPRVATLDGGDPADSTFLHSAREARIYQVGGEGTAHASPSSLCSPTASSWKAKQRTFLPPPSLRATHQEERALGGPVSGAARAVLFAGQDDEGEARLLVPLSGVEHIKLRRRGGRFYRQSKDTACRQRPVSP